jgi:branched-chain amino acid aminotransferase
MTVVWLDGALRPRDEATVSVDDLGFLYGAACFETVRVRDGAVLGLTRHFERLEAGLAALHVTPPDRGTLRRAIAEVVRANDLPEARVRLTVSAGRGSGRPDLEAAGPPSVLVVAGPLVPPADAVRLAVASARLDARRPLATAKTANYLPSLLALSEARAQGSTDALFLDHEEHVVEAATANVFAVIDDALVTPPLSYGPLPGVTRALLIECARALDVLVAERPLTLDDLRGATEVLVTNSVTGPRPVEGIDGVWTAVAVPGPVTTRLEEAYAALERTASEPLLPV